MNLTPIQISNAAKAFRSALDVLHRPAPVSCSDWADQNFYMSPESSYVEGPWKTRPEQRAVLNIMGNDQVEDLDFLKAARVGYTKMLMATVAYQIEHKKRNQIIYQPTDAAGDSFMKEHVQPMIRDVPAVRALASWFGKRHPNNTLASKLFDNRRKLWVFGGAAAKNYREKSVDTVYLDELDGFDEDVEGEGRPDELAAKRTEGSYFPKRICGSTPTQDHKSLIAKRSKTADAFLRCYVPCPHCEHPQTLKFAGLVMLIPGDPESTQYACEACGAMFTNAQFLEVVADCFWWDQEQRIRTQDGIDFFDDDGNPVATPRHIAVHIWSAYSPMTTWAAIMRKFLRVKDDPPALQTFVNQTLGETWKKKGDAPAWRKIYDRTRGGEFKPNQIHDFVHLITIGVDVQRSPGRLELEVVGWGPRKRSQSIDYRVLPGSVDDLGPDGPWEKLRRIVLDEKWKHPSGVHLPASITAIDSGDQTQTVYTFCREFQQPQVIPIKGFDNLTTLFGIPKPQDVNPADGKPIRRGILLWPVGVSLLKQELYSFLKQERPTEEAGEDLPAGWCDFPEYGVDYFKGLCSEQLSTKRNRRGYTVTEWEKIHERNEPLDCRNYARVAAAIRGVDHWTVEDWANLRLHLGLERRPKGAKDDGVEVRNGVAFKSDNSGYFKGGR